MSYIKENIDKILIDYHNCDKMEWDCNKCSAHEVTKSGATICQILESFKNYIYVAVEKI